MDDLLVLLDYDTWSTARILHYLGPLSPAEFRRDLHSSHGGIQGTLAHLFDSDRTWTARLEQSHTLPEELHQEDLPALPDLQGDWMALHHIRRSVVGTLDAQQVLTYTGLDGRVFTAPAVNMVRHVVNHASYHRGQLVTMLRQLGHAAPNTDLIVFYRTRLSAN